jgi:ribulose-phosphate 3-epimerase
MSIASNWMEQLPDGRPLAEVSLWSADLGRLADDMARIDAFTDLYHIDVADGHFSPALLFFPDMAACARKLTARPLHAHLMVSDDILLEQIRQFADAGPDAISIHAENRRIDDALSLIEKLNIRAGLVLQLHTPIAAALPFLDRIAFLTLLGTRIGLKGQDLDPQSEERLREARRLVDGDLRRHGSRRPLVGADGGIREHTVPRLYTAGADTFVMGSLAFRATDLPGRFAWLHSLRRHE